MAVTNNEERISTEIDGEGTSAADAVEDATSPDEIVADDDTRLEAPLVDRAEEVGTVSPSWTLLTFLRGMIGPGCLALPVAFRQAGLWTGLVLVFILGLLNLHCMSMLLNSAKALCERSGKMELDYGHLAKKAFDYGPRRWRSHSRKPLYITNVVISMLQLGVCSVLFVFMARHVKEVLEEAFDDGATAEINESGLNIRYYLLILLLPVILVNYIRSMRVLAVVSTVSNCIMLVVLAVIFQSLIRANHIEVLRSVDGFTDVQSVIVACGSILYAFEGQALVLPLENRISDKKAMRGPFGVMATGMYLVMLLYAATGFLGYATYGSKVQGSITLNLPSTVVYQLLKVALVIVVYGGYAVQMYVVIEMLWPAIRRKCLLGLDQWHLFFEYVFRTALVCITVALAIAIPQLEDIIPLVGVTAGMLLAFVFPPLLEILTFWRVWRRRYAERPAILYIRIAKNGLLVFIGVVGLISGIVLNIQKIVQKYPV